MTFRTSKKTHHGFDMLENIIDLILVIVMHFSSQMILLHVCVCVVL